MPTVSLTSFLKILTKGTPQKVREYSRYLEPGGYDFYWSLKEAAHAHTVGAETLADCAKPMHELTRDVERKHNLSGLQSLSKWMKKFNVTKFFEAPVTNCTSPEEYLTVRLEPEFGIVMNDQRRLVQLWSNTGSSLTRDAVGVGIHLLQTHLCEGEFADCKGGILDLRKRNLFIADAMPANIAAMIATEFAWTDGFFKAHKKAA